jgi:hypothetical protein
MLREEHGLKVFWKRVLRGIFRPKGDEERGVAENCIIRRIIICTIPKI